MYNVYKYNIRHIIIQIAIFKQNNFNQSKIPE